MRCISERLAQGGHLHTLSLKTALLNCSSNCTRQRDKQVD